MKKILLALFLVSPCFATEWKSSGLRNSNIQNIYIDMSSLKQVSNTKFLSVWVKHLQHLKDPKSLTEENYELSEGIFDCTNKKFSLLSHYSYSQNGDILDSFSFLSEEDITRGKEVKWVKVVPDSTAEKLLNFVCSEWEKKSQEMEKILQDDRRIRH
jgi:hypothetical protein